MSFTTGPILIFKKGHKEHKETRRTQRNIVSTQHPAFTTEESPPIPS